MIRKPANIVLADGQFAVEDKRLEPHTARVVFRVVTLVLPSPLLFTL